ncbi:hypothetical protein GUJ93_ZPchr0012g19946 [Zizania palustris]|uniref:Uncharacterized protein n=1 Tax=Zizania palustris TaxID=103762 RepID=A0A8J6BRF2_ZIZPA|nr:hypothetical protein GUJ93_ZPchr0012g19946 [Zizania palustris]
MPHLRVSATTVLFLASGDTSRCAHHYGHLLQRTNTSSERYTLVADERHLLLRVTYAYGDIHCSSMLRSALLGHGQIARPASITMADKIIKL